MRAPVPGTALPWTALGHEGGHYTLGCEGRLEALARSCQQFGAPADIQAKDMIYAAHACNNFPALLEALQWAIPALEDIAENNDIDPIAVCDPEERLCCHACEQSGCLSAKLQKARKAIASATGEA